MSEDVRAEFRQRVAESDRLTEAGDSEGANAQTDALVPLLTPSEHSAELAAVLAPLLDRTETESVRFSAAAYLLSRGHGDLAIPALEDLRDSAAGMAEVRAELLLDQWHNQNV